jgi:tRNA1(Val) A37 N6-methylase TrmN6
MKPEAASQDTTLDAFHRGAFWLVQPARRGHRAGTDAMIVAAAVPSGFSGHVADLGAGAGAAGLAVASRCPQASVTLVERAPEMLSFARRTVALEQNASIAGRVSVLEADISLTGKEREASGLLRDSFDFAVMNPPFNEKLDRASDDPLRRMAHVMDETLFEDWLRTAAAILKPRGGLALIARPSSLDAILTAMRGRFGGVEIMAVHPRADVSAIRIVVRARKAARASASIRPPLFLHDGAGHAFSPRAEAINNGRASLFGD